MSDILGSQLCRSGSVQPQPVWQEQTGKIIHRDRAKAPKHMGPSKIEPRKYCH